jgi:predicted nucleotidyltransferase
MSDEIIYPSTPFPLKDALILLGRRGSEAHNLYVPSTDPDHIDDRDLMGIAIPPRPYYLGLRSYDSGLRWEGTEEINPPWDVVLYEVRKLLFLLLKQNPNVISLLWLDERDLLVRSVEGDALVAHRDLFRHGDLARHTFIHYARDQMKKATTFNREQMQQISDLEARLQEHDVDLARVAEGKWDRQRSNELNALAEQYRGMRRTYHKAYMGAKRWRLVQKVGYDAKNFAHMVRLLHMGYEYLTTGVINVVRTWDRELLLEIKHGEWELERVKAHADEWFARMETAPSVLPTSIDEDKVERLLIWVIEHRLGLASEVD